MLRGHWRTAGECLRELPRRLADSHSYPRIGLSHPRCNQLIRQDGIILDSSPKCLKMLDTAGLRNRQVSGSSPLVGSRNRLYPCGFARVSSRPAIFCGPLQARFLRSLFQFVHGRSTLFRGLQLDVMLLRVNRCLRRGSQRLPPASSSRNLSHRC